jgi:hypothetical protein
LSEVKKCPKCGGEMEKGFLVTPRPLWWDTEKHSVNAGGEKLVPFSFGMHNLDAYRCSKCKLVLFKYGEKS